MTAPAGRELASQETFEEFWADSLRVRNLIHFVFSQSGNAAAAVAVDGTAHPKLVMFDLRDGGGWERCADDFDAEIDFTKVVALACDDARKVTILVSLGVGGASSGLYRTDSNGICVERRRIAADGDLLLTTDRHGSVSVFNASDILMERGVGSPNSAKSRPSKLLSIVSTPTGSVLNLENAESTPLACVVDGGVVRPLTYAVLLASDGVRGAFLADQAGTVEIRDLVTGEVSGTFSATSFEDQYESDVQVGVAALVKDVLILRLERGPFSWLEAFDCTRQHTKQVTAQNGYVGTAAVAVLTDGRVSVSYIDVAPFRESVPRQIAFDPLNSPSSIDFPVGRAKDGLEYRPTTFWVNSFHRYEVLQFGDLEQAAKIVVILHGGPLTHWRAKYDQLVMAMVRCVPAAAVLLPNPPGSTGYGDGFAEHLVGRWGDVDVRSIVDLLEGIRNQRGSEVEISLIGSSYGGFLAARTVAAAPDLFSRAVVVNGFFDPKDVATTSDDQRMIKYLESVALSPNVMRDERGLTELRPSSNGSPLILILIGIDDRTVAPECGYEVSRMLGLAGHSVKVENQIGGHLLPYGQPDALKQIVEFVSQPSIAR
ncbi:alpha/beta fold hydrolase [Rhodococcus erythropolis]|nr:alpha/beta fold hydrolase [Rhodococcus erythropolis]